MNLSEASHNSESRIPNSINPFPVAASVLFEDTDRSTYEIPTAAPVPARINGITSRVNGSSTLPSTSANDSKYEFLVLLFVSFYISSL